MEFAKPRAQLLPILAFAVLTLAVACSEPSSSVEAVEARSDARTPPGGEVVARMPDEYSVTLAELDDYIKNKLFDEETQSRQPQAVYELRLSNLSELLAKRTVKKFAAEEGLTLEQFVQKTRDSVPPITDEEVDAFIASNQDRMRKDVPLDQLRPAIRSQMRRERTSEAMRAVLAGVEPEVLLAPPRIDVAPIGASRGPESAAITIVEFSDYECPFCLRAEPVVQELLAKYGSQVRYVYRHNPSSSHPQAHAAAGAAICAEAQGRFWEYHHQLFANQSALGPDLYSQIADDLALDAERFSACQASSEPSDRIAADARDAAVAGANATPTFFVNGILLQGAQPLEEFDRVIQSELERAERG